MDVSILTMPPQTVPTQSTTVTKPEDRSFEKIFLGLLFFITVTQFSQFGYQSVTYILGLIFNVPVISTSLDVFIGSAAMVASALVFAASAMWWKLMPGAQKFFALGAGLFIVKNVLDLANETILFSMETPVTSMQQIQQLATILGNQFFQLAFWVVVFFYFRYVIRKRTGA
jgi:hypothetical protein